MAITTTILLRTTVVVMVQVTSDAGNSVLLLYMPGNRTRGISEMGFPFHVYKPLFSEMNYII